MLLLRGATLPSRVMLLPVHRFNTCSSCEEQLLVKAKLTRSPFVSIHAPLARSNEGVVARRAAVFGFNTCSSCEEQLEPPGVEAT